MSNEKRGLGDNSLNTSDYIGGVDYLYSALDEAVKLIVKLSKRNAATDKLLNKSIYAKNNLQRGVHLNKAIEVQHKNKSELESFDKILTAINNRQDIHTGLNKSHKLEMCSQSGNFGNYIANNTGSGVAYRVHHDQAGTTYDESNALYFDVTLAANTTTVITNGEIGTNITIEPTASIGSRSATGDALTFSLYGIVAAAR